MTEQIQGNSQVEPASTSIPASVIQAVAADGEEVLEVNKENLEKLIQKRRAANREAQEAKQKARALEEKLKTLEVELQKYQDKDKTETEKLQQKVQMLANELAKRESALKEKDDLLLKESLKTQAVSSGVIPSYADYVSQCFLEAKQSKEDLNLEEWLKEFREKSPAFFAEAKRQIQPTAAGGPGSRSGHMTEIDARVAEIDARIAELTKPGIARRSDRVESELFRLRYERKKLLQQKETK